MHGVPASIAELAVLHAAQHAITPKCLVMLVQ
jgi:hypothetical protein